jgi:signal transduction histidine kinase
LIQKLSNNGITDALSPSEKKIVRVTNFVEFVGVVVSFLMAIVHYALDNYYLQINAQITFAFFITALILNGKGFYNSSKVFAVISALMTITSNTMLAGHLNGTHFLYFTVVAGTLVAFPFNKMIWIIILSSLTVMAFIVSVLYPDFLVIYFEIPRRILSEDIALWYQILGFVFAISSVFAILYFSTSNSHRLESELIATNDELESANKTKDKFISILAHDLRNPIGGLKTLLELVNSEFEEFEEEELSTFIKEMSLTADNIYKLLEDILTWVKTQNEKIDLFVNNICLSHLSEPSTTLYEASLKKKNIKLDIRFDKEMSVYCDQNTMSTVIRNLLSNAIKFTRDGGEVSLEAKETDDNMVLVSVSDNGVGMGEEVLSKLFDIDKNNSIPGTDGERGTGLGLSICKEFVELNGGKIWAKSEKGKGSSFFFTIPKSNLEC